MGKKNQNPIQRGAARQAKHTTRLPDARATRRYGRALVASLPGGTTVALAGPLGAGKTTLVKGMAEGIGIPPDEVTSPTFVLVQPHRAPRGGRRLIHVDAFRLTAREFRDLDLAPGPADLLAVEWADRVHDALPPDAVWIRLAEGPGGRCRTARRG